ncbi:unnamed protein product, partial [marine sediment metagenome]
CESAAIIVKRRFPAGVEVSIFSVKLIRSAFAL